MPGHELTVRNGNRNGTPNRSVKRNPVGTMGTVLRQLWSVKVPVQTWKHNPTSGAHNFRQYEKATTSKTRTTTTTRSTAKNRNAKPWKTKLSLATDNKKLAKSFLASGRTWAEICVNLMAGFAWSGQKEGRRRSRSRREGSPSASVIKLNEQKWRCDGRKDKARIRRRYLGPGRTMKRQKCQGRRQTAKGKVTEGRRR